MSDALNQINEETDTERLAREMHELEVDIIKKIKTLIGYKSLSSFVKFDLIRIQCWRYFEFLENL